MAARMRSTEQAVSARKVARVTSSRPAALLQSIDAAHNFPEIVAFVAPYDRNYPEVVVIAVLRCDPTSAGNGAKSGSTQ